MCNSPATFQAMMDHIFIDMIERNLVIIYMDDMKMVLGLTIKEGQLSMDPVKLKGMKEWPTPSMVKQLRAFLGFKNFYHLFIEKFSEIAMPLNGLLKKNVPFEWSPECQEAFLTLK